MNGDLGHGANRFWVPRAPSLLQLYVELRKTLGFGVTDQAAGKSKVQILITTLRTTTEAMRNRQYAAAGGPFRS